MTIYNLFIAYFEIQLAIKVTTKVFVKRLCLFTIKLLLDCDPMTISFHSYLLRFFKFGPRVVRASLK